MRHSEKYKGEHTENILEECKTSLYRGFVEFSSRVSLMPRKRISCGNVGNRFTPVGCLTTPDKDYSKKRTEYKNLILFPFFISLGFSKAELILTWKRFNK
jgi:hypothetical protein